MSNEIFSISEDVEKRLGELFKKRLNMEIKDQDALLFGKSIGLSARDLVYVCLDIEKEFCVSIDDQCIENYLLATFGSIKNFILSRMGEVSN